MEDWFLGEAQRAVWDLGLKVRAGNGSCFEAKLLVELLNEMYEFDSIDWLTVERLGVGRCVIERFGL